jgi:hypothetical protein
MTDFTIVFWVEGKSSERKGDGEILRNFKELRRKEESVVNHDSLYNAS